MLLDMRFVNFIGMVGCIARSARVCGGAVAYMQLSWLTGAARPHVLRPARRARPKRGTRLKNEVSSSLKVGS